MGTEMTAKAVQAICKETGGYNTKNLNEKLYLHFKGWAKIENLEEFTGARVVWLEGNGLQKIEGLQNLTGLRQIYLQQNCIKDIENLEGLEEVRALNLSENFVEKIDNISCLPNLETIQLNNNHLETLESVEHLRDCPQIRVVELSKCKLEDPEIIDVFESMPELKLLKLDGNPVVRKIPQYRKTLISRLKSLTYLDDRPVFEEERQTAEAWARGGVEAEKMERQRQRELKKAKEERRHKAFMKMMEDAKRERRAEKKAQEELAATTQSSENVEASDATATCAREAAQEELVEKLAKEAGMPTRRARQGGGRRTKCVIKQTTDETPVKRTTCVIKQVSADSNDSASSAAPPVWPAAKQDEQAGTSEVGNARKSKSRKDRQERLRKAMAAVDAERDARGVASNPTAADDAKEAGTSAAPASEAKEAPAEEKEAPRFAHLSAKDIEQQLETDGNVAVDDEPACELVEDTVKSAAPTIYGTSQYDELWAKASQINPELSDGQDATSVVQNNDMEVLDVEELD